MSARFSAAWALSAFLGLMLCANTLLATTLPWWIDSINVSPPGTGGWGSVTLEGTWIDTGAPDAISHTYRDGTLHLTVAAPDLNVATGDALTPWTLTEEFVLSDPNVNEIFGSIYSVDPNNRGDRLLVSGPDFLGWIIPPPRGEFHGLGALGTPNHEVSEAFDVSADGKVVTGRNRPANSAGEPRVASAFVWSSATGMINVSQGSRSLTSGRGISPDGHYMVGDGTFNPNIGGVSDPHQEAFRWSLGTGLQSLGTIQGVSSESQARATSRNGAVVVGVDEFYPPGVPGARVRRGFVWSESNGMTDIGTLPEYGERSTTELVDVNANGSWALGTAYRGENATDVYHSDLAQPFLWRGRTGYEPLGNAPRFFPAIFPPPQQETIASAISADGATVVGVDRVYWPPFVDSFTPYEHEEAVLWNREDGWQFLGEFRMRPGPFLGSEATGVSGEGDLVVGNAFLLSDSSTGEELGGDLDEFGRLQVPFLWDTAHGMRPLARVLANDYGLDLEGWRLFEATAISDDGTTIVGNGVNPDGMVEAWRAAIHRNTRTGDADFDGDVDMHDRALLVANLGMTSDTDEVYYNSGDFDGDGRVAAGDLALLMSNYDGRFLGDFNGDGLVDTADYTVWRDHEGDTSGIADANGDGVANGADLAAWQANYGATLTEAALATTATVPEPVALLIASFSLLCVVRRSR